MFSIPNSATPDDTATSPTKKRATAGHFMTPVRRILYRLEWSKSAQKRRNKLIKPHPKSNASTTQSVLDSVSEEYFRLSPFAEVPSLSRGDGSSHDYTTPKRPGSYRTHSASTVESKFAASKDGDNLDMRGPDSDAEFATEHKQPDAASASPILTSRRSRVAIQQEDSSLDAIVVTTLPNYPFSCHADLLGMSRAELLTVAHALNSRLPANSASQIPIDDDVLDAVIRSRIEVLVGIRPPVPMAPKAVKCAQSLSVAIDVDGVGDGTSEDAGVLASPPSSPLAMREKRRKGVGSSSGRIAARLASTAIRDDSDVDAMDGVTGDAVISPRRFLERLDEVPEPDESEVELEDSSDEGNYYDDEDDDERALRDPFSAHVMKRRKVSSDGQYARILSVEPKRTVVGRPLPFSSFPMVSPPLSAPVFAVPAMQYKFSVPRKPVVQAHGLLHDLMREHDRGVGGSGGSPSKAQGHRRSPMQVDGVGEPGQMMQTTMVGSDSIDFLFQGGKPTLDATFSRSRVIA